jgi:hypothetical protein
MNDFDDDFDAFFSNGVETPQTERPYGLVVPPKARLILGPDGVVYDELAEMERDYRTKGRPVMEFEESDEDDTDGRPINVGPAGPS